ncbi:hypothetical protein C4K27_2717 [Pseudomonas chlororaphis subsp. chlororaphis]|nr:hypothetical protein C4K27_2717 [Pseudomonas chlororaphis subsp. chlororaphis]
MAGSRVRQAASRLTESIEPISGLAPAIRSSAEQPQARLCMLNRTPAFALLPTLF